MTVLCYHCQCFLTILCHLITYLTVCGACQAFLLTEEADADAVKPHTCDVLLSP